MKRALALKRSREELAAALGVQPHDVALRIAARAFPPEEVFEKVLDIIAEGNEGYEVLAGMLGDEFALVPLHTLAEGLDLVRSHAVDAIVCGQHFESSQMLRFLEAVKGLPAAAAIPFICCRTAPTSLRTTALAAMREACEALGAVAYIDLPELERDAGTGRAAVEFRDAVRAALRLKAAPQVLRILVVDDNADAAHTLAAYKASSGEEALRVGGQVKPHAAVLTSAWRHVGIDDADRGHGARQPGPRGARHAGRVRLPLCQAGNARAAARSAGAAS